MAEKKKIVAEMLYFPHSLKFLAAGAVKHHKIPLDGLPEDLKEFCQTAKGLKSTSMAKDRTCASPSVGGAITIGGFCEFPFAICEPQLPMFNTDIIVQARSVMRYLREMERDKRMDDVDVLRHVLQVRYPKFLRLQASVYPELLLPPKDVAVVWFCHMLQSLQYEKYINKYIADVRLMNIPHPCVRAEDTPERRAATVHTSHTLWKGVCAYDTCKCALPKTAGPRAAMHSKYVPFPEDVVADRQWIVQFVCATSKVGLREQQAHPPPAVSTPKPPAQAPSQPSVFGKLMQRFKTTSTAPAAAPLVMPAPPNEECESARESDAFLRRSLLGYQRFMFLLAKWPRRMEGSFSPCPAIDLIWHTHLVQPAEYRRFCKRMLWSVHHHKLLPEHERTPMTYNASTNDCDQLWLDEFNESQSIYLTSIFRTAPDGVIRNKCAHCRCEISSGQLRYRCQICYQLNYCDRCLLSSGTPAVHLNTHTMFPMRI